MPQEPTSDDRLLAQAARRKEAAGQQPTTRETAALRRVNRYLDGQFEKRFLENFSHQIPKKLYNIISGKSTKTLHNQADLYGVPVRGAAIDLHAVLQWLHDTLAKQGHRLVSDGDQLFLGASQSLKDEYVRQQIAEKREKARLAQLDRLEREGQLCDVATIRAGLQLLADHLRNFGDGLQRELGPEALDRYNEFLDDFTRASSKLFADPSTLGDQTNANATDHARG